MYTFTDVVLESYVDSLNTYSLFLYNECQQFLRPCSNDLCN